MIESHGDYQPTALEQFILSVPVRYYLMLGGASLTGTLLGGVRGARKASMQYLAENAHNPPRTLRGWYLYKKTKNYKVMLAGLQEGGRETMRLGAITLGWIGCEEGMNRAGLDEVREIGAGLGTAGLFSVACRLPRPMAQRAVVVGLTVGVTMRALRYLRGEIGR